MGYLQLFSEQLHVPRSGGSLVFHPLNIIPLKFSGEVRRIHILSSETFGANLPVHFDIKDCSSHQSSSKSHDRTEKRCKLSRVKISPALHETIELSLKNVEEVTLKWLPCSTLDIEAVLFHLMLTL